MKSTKVYVCPKCGSTNMKVSLVSNGAIGNINNGICGDCGYDGTFAIKESIQKPKNHAKNFLQNTIFSGLRVIYLVRTRSR